MTDLVVWRKPPPLVSKSLYNKATKLSLKEALWVWDDVIALGACAALIALSILWLALPYTMQGWAIVLLACSGILLAGSFVVFFSRVNGVHDPLLFNYTKLHELSHSGRKQLCLLDRNRKRAPGWERSWRMPHIDHNQYSVWVSSENRGTHIDELGNEVGNFGLMFRIIEHRPRRYGLGPRWAMVCQQQRYLKVSHGDDDSVEEKRHIYAMNAERFEANVSFEKATEIQSDLEEIADYLEGYGYNSKVKVHEVERIALQLRR